MSHMVRMGLRPASLALAAALCFGSSAQAADDPLVAQASVTLSGLSFQLIDLTPGDGIAPSLTFQTEGVIDSWNSVYDEASVIEETPEKAAECETSPRGTSLVHEVRIGPPVEYARRIEWRRKDGAA